MSGAETIFTAVGLAQIATLLPHRVRSTRVIPQIDVHIPAISYGQTRPPEFGHWQYPPDNWFERSYSLHDGFAYSLLDAKVHGELGIVTMDDYVLAESLYLTVPEANGLTWVDATHFRMPNPDAEMRMPKAIHALCGYVGNRNYAHWWVDIVPVIGLAVESGWLQDGTLLFPPLPSRYHRQTLDLMPEIAGHNLEIGAQARVHCDELTFVPRLTASDYTPDPGRMRFVAELKRRAGAEGRASRKVYLSRRDATGRPLANAEELEGIAADLGYEVVTTSDLSVSDQIRLFADASHLISPHGAGLANMLFCRPWARLLELHYDRCINWSLRRLSAVVPMTYGCLIGRQEECGPDQSEEASKNNPWRVDPGEFRDAVLAMS